MARVLQAFGVLSLVVVTSCGGATPSPKEAAFRARAREALLQNVASGPLSARRLDIRYSHARRSGLELRALTLELDGERLYSRRLPEGVEAFAPTELYDGPVTAGAHQVRFVSEWEFRYFGATCHYGAPKHARVVTVHRIELGEAPASLCIRTGPRSTLQPTLESIEPRIDESVDCVAER